MNKGQGCSTSEYKYVGSLQVTVMDDNAMFGEINKLGFRCYFVAECPNGHPYYVGEVSDAFYCHFKSCKFKTRLVPWSPTLHICFHGLYLQNCKIISFSFS